MRIFGHTFVTSVLWYSIGLDDDNYYFGKGLLRTEIVSGKQITQSSFPTKQIFKVYDVIWGIPHYKYQHPSDLLGLLVRWESLRSRHRESKIETYPSSLYTHAHTRTHVSSTRLPRLIDLWTSVVRHRSPRQDPGVRRTPRDPCVNK